MTTLVDPVAAGDLVLRARRHGDQPRSRRRHRDRRRTPPAEEHHDQLPVSRSSTPRRTTRTPLLADLAASAQAKAAESAALRRIHAGSQRRPVGPRPPEMARRFAAGRTDVHLRQRRQLHRRPPRLAALFARPAGRKSRYPPVVVDRRPGDRDRAGQRRRVRAGVRPPVDRPRAGRRHRDRDVDQRQLPNLLAALAEARAPRHVHGRFRRLRRWRVRGVNPNVDVCFIVRSQSVHRIQESQALLGYQLWSAVQRTAPTIEDWGPHEQVSG